MRVVPQGNVVEERRVGVYVGECLYNEAMARLKGDTNYDCKVNLVDFAAMALNWATNESLVSP